MERFHNTGTLYGGGKKINRKKEVKEDNNNKLEKINHTLKLKIRGSQFKDN